MRLIISLSIFSILLSSCSALNTPETPTLTALVSVNGYQQTETYIAVYNLSQAQLTWDVSYIPDAVGVDVVISKQQNCDNEIAHEYVNYTDSARQVMLMGYQTGAYNPIENLGVIFQSESSKITSGTYYVCIRAVTYDKRTSGLSYPVTINIIY